MIRAARSLISRWSSMASAMADTTSCSSRRIA